MSKIIAVIVGVMVSAGCGPVGPVRPTPVMAQLPNSFGDVAVMGELGVTVGAPRMGLPGHASFPVAVRNNGRESADAPTFRVSLKGRDCGEGQSDTYMKGIRRGATRTAVMTWNCRARVAPADLVVTVDLDGNLTLWEQ